MQYRKMSIEEKRAELLVDPPRWKYNPATGMLTGPRGATITVPIHNGVYYNKRAIRVWLATGFYPEEVEPTTRKETRLPDGTRLGGKHDYRLVNLKYEYPKDPS
jgi:hypothetical protein